MTDYITDEAHGDNWSLLLGDSCERLAELGENSVEAQLLARTAVENLTELESEMDAPTLFDDADMAV